MAIANPALGVSVLPAFKDRVRFKNPAVHQRAPALEDTTIIFNNLKLSDEAQYICEYTTFPAGNRESMVNLTVYGKLKNIQLWETYHKLNHLNTFAIWVQFISELNQLYRVEILFLCYCHYAFSLILGGQDTSIIMNPHSLFLPASNQGKVRFNQT